MLKFEETKVIKEKFYAAIKTTKIWDVNVDNIVTANLVEKKSNSKNLIGYSDKIIRSLALIMLKMNGYVKKFKVEDKNSKLMSFRIDDEKLLERFVVIWTNIEDIQNIELNVLKMYWVKCFTSLWSQTYKNQNKSIRQ